MCLGFGCIIDKDINLYFCEPDNDGNCSHSAILDRLDWQDNDDEHIRNFVRIEFPDWTAESFEFDEHDSLPGWAEENRQEIQDKAVRLLSVCAPAWAEYEKVRNTARAEYEKVCDTAWAEYEKVSAPARAEYEKARNTAWAEYEKVSITAWAEYEKVSAPARAEYEKVCDPAMAEYAKVRNTARAEYEKVRNTAWAEMINRLSKITGYVPE